jgi:hypothetical protein
MTWASKNINPTVTKAIALCPGANTNETGQLLVFLDVGHLVN